MTNIYAGFCFKKAETRAEFAERTVSKLEKTIDDLEGTPCFSPTLCLPSLLSALVNL